MHMAVQRRVPDTVEDPIVGINYERFVAPRGPAKRWWSAQRTQPGQQVRRAG